LRQESSFLKEISDYTKKIFLGIRHYFCGLDYIDFDCKRLMPRSTFALFNLAMKDSSEGGTEKVENPTSKVYNETERN